jgi:DNA-binding NarL/FixJ family response regulator
MSELRAEDTSEKLPFEEKNELGDEQPNQLHKELNLGKFVLPNGLSEERRYLAREEGLRNLITGLTPSQQDILGLITLGFSDVEIAQKIGITVGGIKYHTGLLYAELRTYRFWAYGDTELSRGKTGNMARKGGIFELASEAQGNYKIYATGEERKIFGATKKAISEIVFEPDLNNSPFKELNSRQQEVLDQLYEGLTNIQIGEKLNITEKTVKSHLSNIYEKLGVGGREEAVNHYAFARMGKIISNSATIWMKEKTEERERKKGQERALTPEERRSLAYRHSVEEVVDAQMNKAIDLLQKAGCLRGQVDPHEAIIPINNPEVLKPLQEIGYIEEENLAKGKIDAVTAVAALLLRSSDSRVGRAVTGERSRFYTSDIIASTLHTRLQSPSVNY